MCTSLSECDADRTFGCDHAAGVFHAALFRVKLHLDDRIAVLVCHVETAVIRVEGDEAWGESHCRVVAEFLHVTSLLVDAVENDGFVDAVGTDEDLTVFIKERGAGLSFSGVCLGKCRQVLARKKLSVHVIKAEICHLVALFIDQVRIPVVRMDCDVARLIVLSGAEAVGLGESPVFCVKAVYENLTVALDPSLGHNKKVGLCLIPDTLVCEGDSSLFFARKMSLRDDLAEASVFISLNDIDSAALKSSND